ncbi:MAG: EamA/RhaT family transporter [Gammaproteobacteria bacterium]|nr:MAG: EamA/RhaT family transporter [Gammaproteobacteria bacterium]
MFWYPLRLLESSGLSGLWLTLIVYAVALCAFAQPVWRGLAYWRAQPGLLALLALAAGWCNAAFILAVLEGTVVRVLLLFYLSPIWTVVLGWFVLGERPTGRGWFAFSIAMAGALIMLWSEDLGGPWPKGKADWLAVSSGMAFSLANVLVRRLQEVPVITKTATAWVGAVFVALVWIAAATVPVPQVAAGTVIGAMALGLFGMVVMTFSVQYGVTHMPVHRSAVILLFELVAGAISAQLLTDEKVLAQEWVGGVMVLLAAWLAASRRARTNERD